MLGIADRLDSIAGIFSVSKGPTGSADPFGLRRAAIAVISVLRERGWHLSLKASVHQGLLELEGKRKKDLGIVEKEVLDFFRTRLKGVLTADGAAVDGAEAVLSAGFDDVVDAVSRGEALAALRKTPDFEPVAITFKRVANFARDAQKKGYQVPEKVEAARLVHPTEKALLQAVGQVESTIQDALARRDFGAAFGTLGTLRPVVAEFIDAVKVIDDDPEIRAQRLGLLAQVRNVFAPLADLGKLS